MFSDFALLDRILKWSKRNGFWRQPLDINQIFLNCV